MFEGGLWWTAVVVVGEVSLSVGDFSGILIVSGRDVDCCWWSGVVGCGVSPQRC